jgi:hypothetical protein
LISALPIDIQKLMPTDDDNKLKVNAVGETRIDDEVNHHHLVHRPWIVKSRQVDQKWLTVIVDDGVHVLDEGHRLITIFYQGDGVALRTETVMSRYLVSLSDKAVGVSDPIEWGWFAWTYLSDQINGIILDNLRLGKTVMHVAEKHFLLRQWLEVKDVHTC